MGDILYNFPSSPINDSADSMASGTDILVDPDSVHLIVQEYLILSVFCAFILFMFIIVCWSFDTKRISPPGFFVRWQNGTQKQNGRMYAFVHECLWAAVLVSLTAVVGVFDWFNFFSPSSLSIGIWAGLSEE